MNKKDSKKKGNGMANKYPYVKIEYPGGKTYGECLQAESDSIALVNGAFRSTLHILNKPKPMSRREAYQYYNRKLQRIWIQMGML
jgi:hypothetical protein